MAYLDYTSFAAFLARHAAVLPAVSERLVGVYRRHDSGYCAITRFFASGGIDPRRVALRYRPDPFVFDDSVIESYARNIESELRAAGRLYVGPMATAVVEEYFSTLSPQLLLQPCDYGLFAGSCFALDHPDPVFGDSATLREYAHRYRSVLPQCMGVCGLLVTTESDGSRRVMAVNRAGHLASLTHSVGPSAAGSVDFRAGWTTLQELMYETMAAEIAEELGLGAHEYAITPLACAREMFRGGKPQLFCRIDTGLSSGEVLDRLAVLTGRPEFTDSYFFPLDSENRMLPDDLVRLNHEAAMNWFLVEEHASGA